MHLTRVVATDLRPFSRLDLTLGETGLTLLVGPNNVGKSAALLALDALAGIDVGPLTRLGGTSQAEVAATFSLTGADRKSLTDQLVDAEWWFDSGAFQTLVLTLVERRRAADRSEFVLKAALTRLGSGVTLPLVTPSEDDTGFEMLAWPEFLQAGSGGRNIRATDHVSSDVAHPNVHAFLGPFGPLFTAWQLSYFHFSEIRSGAPREQKLDSVPRLTPTGDNLGAVLLDLRSNAPDKFDAIRAAMAEVVPDAGELTVRTGQGVVRVMFQEPATGSDINLKDLGSGVEQLLLAAVVGVSQPPGALTVLEEPETGLHSGAQRDLARLLRRWGRTQQVVATTHSPVVIDLEAGEATTVVVRREGSVSSMTSDVTGGAGLLTELGVRLSDVLSSERLLLVEGETDRQIVRAWFADQLDAGRVGVVPLGGGDRMWDVPTLQRVVEAANVLEQPVRVLRDRDELDDEQLGRLAEMGIVTVLSVREIENHLLDPASINARLRELECDFEISQSAIDEEADGLRDLVLAKRVAQRLPPVRLMDRKRVQQIVGATKDEYVNAVCAEYPDPSDVAARVADAFDQEQVALDAIWVEQRRALAPGDDVLRRLFSRAGRSFDKSRDGVAIARHMSAPPKELVDLVDGLVAPGARQKRTEN